MNANPPRLVMAGPLKGEELEVLPSVMTDWRSWKANHPDGTVAMLDRTSREYRNDFDRDPTDFVLGIAGEGPPRAWRLDLLRRDPVRNESWAERPVVAAFDPESATARLFDRRIDDRVLTFLALGENQMKDEQTGSTWDRVTGRTIAGPLQGQALEAMPAILSYTEAWLKFYPETELVGSP